MDEDLYDEFGNFIGDENDSDAELDSEEGGSSLNESSEFESESEEEQEDEPSNALTIREDNQSLIQKTFGPDVDVVIQQSDTQTINDPLIKPLESKKVIVEEKQLPEIKYSRDYWANLARNTLDRIRNVSLVGNLHSGKTSLLDTLIFQTHPNLNKKQPKNYKPLRYTDNHKLEIERGISMKCSAVSLLLPDIKDRSMVVNIVDTPGHLNFLDEVYTGQNLTDSSILVIDIVEGLTKMDKLVLKNCFEKNLGICVVINKIDRLILELKLPVLDAYYKIRYILADINHYITYDLKEFLPSYKYSKIISPELNNVAFASSKLQFVFNLRSFAKKYSELNNLYGTIDLDKFSKRLWGDNVCFDEKNGKFFKKKNDEFEKKNSFIIFILEPLYKLFTICVSKDALELQKLLMENFQIKLNKNDYKLDTIMVLTKVCSKFFNNNYGFMDMIQNSVLSPVESFQEFNEDSEISKIINDCSNDGPLIAHVGKLINTTQGDSFFGLTRIYSGTLKVGDKIKIIDDDLEGEEGDDLIELEVKELFIPCGRYNFSINEVGSGIICLIGGDISQYINKSATLYDKDFKSKLLPFKQNFNKYVDQVFKVSIKPKDPSHLPELLLALQKINKSYIGSDIKVEETGEYIISGPGELYLDSILYDIRFFHGDNLEIKVSEPFVRFQESILEKTLAKIDIYSTNNKNMISIICEPLEKKLSIDISKGKFENFHKLNSRQLSKIFQNDYNWDALAGKSIWEIDNIGKNILINDILPGKIEKSRLLAIKESVIQGFLWAIKQGPLCSELISNVKFRIIDVKLSDSIEDQSSGQILPMVRKACYASFLTSTPQLLEPIYEVTITCFEKSIDAIKKILEKRRGFILEIEPIVATPLLNCIANLPILDSVGFETDLRLLTQGQAMGLLKFKEWEFVKGDPLDVDAFIPKLKPAHPKFLARDLVVKTRRRKGIDENLSLEKYVDQTTIDMLKSKGIL